MNASEIERHFTIKQLQAYNSKLRSEYNAARLETTRLRIHQEKIIKKEVEIRTIEYKNQLDEKDKIINEKDKEIEALKNKIAHMQSKLDNDASNSYKININDILDVTNNEEKTGTIKGISQFGSKYDVTFSFRIPKSWEGTEWAAKYNNLISKNK